MKILSDFRCSNNHISEEYIERDINRIQCRFCSNMADKQISAPRHIRVDGYQSGIDGDQWAKARIANSRRYKEHNE